MKPSKKSIILKTLLVALIVAGVAVGVFFLLRYLGFTDEERLKEFMSYYGVYFWVIVAALQFIQVIFIPVSNQIVSAPISAILKDYQQYLWKLYVASVVGIFLATIVLYFIGKYGGKKILNWILKDKEKTEKMREYMHKSQFFYPVGMCIPFIPDDILTTLAGLGNYNFAYVFVVALLSRAICIAVSVWGISWVMAHLTVWWVWVIVALCVIAMVLLTIGLFKFMKKKPQMIYQYYGNKLINIYPNVKAANKNTYVNRGSIYACLNGKRKSAGGFRWIRK